MMGWLSLVLWVDRAGGGGGIWLQRGLGLLTWTLLALALLRVTPLVRAQTLVVVAFATVVEYVFSPTLHVYTYRFDNVPAYVPPGHGLVYLSAFALATPRSCSAGCARGSLGVLVVGEPGRRTACCSPSARTPWEPLVRLPGAVLGVRAVEAGLRRGLRGGDLAGLPGTHLGNWEWGRTDFTGWVTIGNPPLAPPVATGGSTWWPCSSRPGCWRWSVVPDS